MPRRIDQSPRGRALRDVKLRVAKKFQSKCFICHKRFRRTARKMLFHHIWYQANDVYYKDYKNSYEYNLALEAKINENPSRFLLLCFGHHHMLEQVIKMDDDKFQRLCEARQKTVDRRKAKYISEDY